MYHMSPRDFIEALHQSPRFVKRPDRQRVCILRSCWSTLANQVVMYYKCGDIELFDGGAYSRRKRRYALSDKVFVDAPTCMLCMAE